MKAESIGDNFPREAALRKIRTTATSIIGHATNDGTAKLTVHFSHASELPLPIAMAKPASVGMPNSFRRFGINE